MTVWSGQRIAVALGLVFGLAWGLPAWAGVGGEGPQSVVRQRPDPDDPPAIPREFRAVWVATVANIDWPSDKGLPVTQQQQELVAILDRAAELHLNAVILQVRPCADALYPSELEPWSEFLTGVQGKAPEPRWDPLAFAVREAHDRGLELHAWVNPYRAGHPDEASERAAGHVGRTMPESVHDYGAYQWMDPGAPEVQKHSLAVLEDIATRYPVDGIHMDDYFYPYPVDQQGGGKLPFPDERSWQRYRKGGGKAERDDWRRASVDGFVESIHKMLQRRAPDVAFGVSPFGIWRPGHPEQIQGFDAYGMLYADARKWLQESWVDYLAPQLYWEISKPQQSFIALLDWWIEQAPEGRDARPVWPGLAAYRVGGKLDAEEIPHQVQWSRIRSAGRQDPGVIFFSCKTLMNDQEGVATSLRNGVFAQQALTPAMPWQKVRKVGRLKSSLNEDEQGGEASLVVDQLSAGGAVMHWVVQWRQGGAWRHRILPGSTTRCRLSLAAGKAIDRVVVRGVGRNGELGEPLVLRDG